jgi:hypothetical protein
LNNIDEENLLAELFVELKGPKKKRSNWIDIAKKVRAATQLYGSIGNTAKKLGVSYELIRSILTLLTFPREVQILIKDNKIGYDAAQRLYRIRDPTKQVQVANTIAGMTSHKQREIIQYATKYPEYSLERFKARVKAPAITKEKIHVLILPIRNTTYKALKKQASKEKTSPEKVILRIIEDWNKSRVRA